MTNQFAINVITCGAGFTVGMGAAKLWFRSSIPWLVTIVPFSLAWFYITYGYVWMLYLWQ